MDISCFCTNSKRNVYWSCFNFSIRSILLILFIRGASLYNWMNIQCTYHASYNGYDNTYNRIYPQYNSSWPFGMYYSLWILSFFSLYLITCIVYKQLEWGGWAEIKFECNMLKIDSLSEKYTPFHYIVVHTYKHDTMCKKEIADDLVNITLNPLILILLYHNTCWNGGGVEIKVEYNKLKLDTISKRYTISIHNDILSNMIQCVKGKLQVTWWKWYVGFNEGESDYKLSWSQAMLGHIFHIDMQ